MDESKLRQLSFADVKALKDVLEVMYKDSLMIEMDNDIPENIRRDYSKVNKKIGGRLLVVDAEINRRIQNIFN